MLLSVAILAQVAVLLKVELPRGPAFSMNHWRLVKSHEVVHEGYYSRGDWLNIRGYSVSVSVLKHGHERCGCWRNLNPTEVELFRPHLGNEGIYPKQWDGTHLLTELRAFIETHHAQFNGMVISEFPTSIPYVRLHSPAVPVTTVQLLHTVPHLPSTWLRSGCELTSSDFS